MKEFDIEFLQLSLKQNINLLKCFDEFCDESILPETANPQKRSISSECFVNRLGEKRALLEVALSGLEQSSNMLEDFLQNTSKGGVQNVR